ncbi:MAG: dTDP-4-dehydrorhamnose reductase [Parcubacteria group bacterium]|nr:dTDP-4-dehydrorhamnose reductase [Parcubacteria group bacterium]
MKTLIVGASGMLGVELAKAFADDKPTLWDIDEIDITDPNQVHDKVGTLAPELIINAAAYTNVDACEENEELATRVNGAAVGHLADVASRLGATLVHYSTDYVFDGSKQAGYSEEDMPNPINAYGRSKLAGERAIMKASKPLTRSSPLSYYLIRTAWLYGHGGKNFVETMLSLAEKGEPIKVVDDQIGSPTYAPDLAQATAELVASKAESGIYHRTNSGITSWYGFAKAIFGVYGKDVDVSPCTTSEYPRPAKRPSYSVLQSTKLPPLRAWQEALGDYAEHHS